MSLTLREIAEQLQASDSKVQLIYAFNGNGKTRLSREFKELMAPKDENEENTEENRSKILYYNAFTEDLFYWDNDLEGDAERKLVIQPNAYTSWVLQDQGLDQNIIDSFQRHTSDRLTPRFNAEYKKLDKSGNDTTVKAFSEVTFSFERGNAETSQHVKISKGEESVFNWSVFYNLVEQVIDILNEPEPSDRDSNSYDDLKYVFIDDPVSSLDDNHLIRLAADIAALIRRSHFYDLKGVRFIITTHNPLFYNVLSNEFARNDKESGWKEKQLGKFKLAKYEDETFALETQATDSPFSYHLFLNDELKKAIEAGQIHKYHFNFLRNILEKMSTFLGYKNWEELLPPTRDGTTDTYAKRVVNWGSHSKHAGDEVSDLDEEDKRVLKYPADSINEANRFHFKREEARPAQQVEGVS